MSTTDLHLTYPTCTTEHATVLGYDGDLTPTEASLVLLLVFDGVLPRMYDGATLTLTRLSSGALRVDEYTPLDDSDGGPAYRLDEICLIVEDGITVCGEHVYQTCGHRHRQIARTPYGRRMHWRQPH